LAELSSSAKASKVVNRRVHMANERTFLAWIRTSIGIMAFGFVVEKFALFMREFSYLVGKTAAIDAHAPVPSPGYSSFLGVFLVGLGAVMGLLAFVQYKKVEKQIDDDTYHPSLLLDTLLAISILAVGIFLIFILIHSI
jgi:putative membrane protein